MIKKRFKKKKTEKQVLATIIPVKKAFCPECRTALLDSGAEQDAPKASTYYCPTCDKFY